ncbi:MAG: type II toxin-antitoxin system RelE/ParE family toxin [Flavobacterium lindanitolerans]|uniref:type II toxin-antitoxin system RelE/ParE family toxin n=1 Tax=Flavobacterium lindanitolerans TaxID=428988 RepID=UPI001A48967B|nr:type II toxin-antitoxin system RelE/ParE family toxin [Flavobacterium lindanitolerans]MBL7867169.1 type II toxin-antitoxin system RelE/ParE family toxin [Flavobacterium lindanitolerans]
MELIFKDLKLADLYEGRKISDKNYRFDSALVKQYQKVIIRLRAITHIEQLFQFHALNYEKLKGNLKGKSSVRINKKYRLIFEEVQSIDNPTEITILLIEEISNHYE